MSENDLNTANSVNGNGNEIDQIIIIDREVDMISPLCTQVTYEGFFFFLLFGCFCIFFVNSFLNSKIKKQN